MNGIVNKFLLAGEKFMPEMYLKQPGFTYSVCRPFTKDNERIQKFKETGDKNYIYKNKLDKVCFQHDMAYGDFRDLARRWMSKGACFYGLNFFDKKSTQPIDKSAAGSGVNMHANNKIKQNQRPLDLATHQLAEELHKPIIKKLKKQFIQDSQTIFGMLIQLTCN